MSMLDKIPVGKKAPDEINVIIEVPMGSPDKIEYDEGMEAFVLDRVLYTRMTYPGNYGMVPQTESGDGDPVDCLVLGDHPISTGLVVAARPVGVLVTEDEGGEDSKIVAVVKKDPRYDSVKDIKDVNDHTKKEIAHFFEQYKALEPGKWVKVKGWEDAARARHILRDGIERFKQEK